MSWLNNGPTIVGRTYFYLVTTVCSLFILCTIASDLRAAMISWWVLSTVPCIPDTRPTACVHAHRIWWGTSTQPKTAKCRFVAAKSRRKAMKVCNSLWTNKTKTKGRSKINEHIKRNLYTWITCHPQVVQWPISNDCLKVVLYDQTEPTLVPKLLLQVSVRELHNSLVSDPNDGGLKGTKMVKFYWNTRKYVTCVNKNLHQINLQKYTPEES